MNNHIFLAMIELSLINLLNSQSCTTDSNCNNGICTKNSTCVCNPGFFSFGSNGTCNYEQKNKLTAFLLSILIGTTGADWYICFYIEFYDCLILLDKGHVRALVFKVNVLL